MISTRKIYSFIIDEKYRDKSSRYYYIKLKLEYENTIINYIYGFNDYLTDSGLRTDNKAFSFVTIDKEEVKSFIEFVAKKRNIKEFLIENL